MRFLIIVSLIIATLSSCSDIQRDNRLWKNGVIPYAFLNVSSNTYITFKAATKIWERNLRKKEGNRVIQIIKFEDRTGKSKSKSKYPRVLFITEKVLDKEVGATTDTALYSPKKNMTLFVNSNLQVKCKYICHELGHVIGLDIHEFQRMDRDLYIKFNYNYLAKLSLMTVSQFLPEYPRFYNIKNYHYDYFSIMNYEMDTLYDSAHLLQSFLLEPAPGGMMEIPSDLDFKKVKDMYIPEGTIE